MCEGEGLDTLPCNSGVMVIRHCDCNGNVTFCKECPRCYQGVGMHNHFQGSSTGLAPQENEHQNASQLSQ